MAQESGQSVSLAGKRCVVVGASAGIGKQTAMDMVSMGGDVVFVGRSKAKLDEAVAEAGGGHVVVADISDPAQCAALIKEAAGHLGGIDMLLTVVGVSRLGLLAEGDPEIWEECLRNNVIGPALVTSAAIPVLSDNAFVGFFSSESVGMPYHGLVPYGTSKAALEEMIRGFRAEHPEFRFSCLRVGATQGTEFARDFDADKAMNLSETWIKRGNIPTNFMTAEDLGRAIARIIAIAMEFEGIDYQDLVLRATGGSFYGTVEELMAQMAEAQE